MRSLLVLSLIAPFALFACDDGDDSSPTPADAAVQLDMATVDTDMATVEADMATPQLDMDTTEADMATPRLDMAVEGDMAMPQLDMTVEADMDAPALDMAVEADMAAPEPLCGDGAQLCFSNRDCPDMATVCLVDPNDPLLLACCQPGDRGVDPVGTPCGDDGERTCATAVCISGDSGGFCSGICEFEEDCPPTMQRCLAIGIEDNVEGWCFPTE